jgi:MFS family permease
MHWALVALVSLGVWLHAADALVTTTVMPSAIAEIGGLPYIYWTIALYELGSIVAGAMTGLMAVRLGLRDAMSAAALVYVLGCVASALAPSMAVMLVGRLVQGLGGGAMLALSYVGVSQLFPQHLWPRILALVSGVWGVSALVGPLVGGALATIGLWRGAFWAFAAQGVALTVLTPLLIRGRAAAAGGGDADAGGDRAAAREHTRATRSRTAAAGEDACGASEQAASPGEHAGATSGQPAPPGEHAGAASEQAVPGRQVLALTAGVLAVSAAGVQEHVAPTVALAALGVVALALVLRLERGARHRLFPPTPLSFAVAWGPGYVMVLALATATVSFTVYGPLLMAELFDVTPFTAGFILAIESVAWTLAAIAVARAEERRERALIRGGAVLIAAGVVGLAVTMPRGPVWALLPWASLQGAGFGVCWAFLLRRIVATVPDGERERASSAMPTLQMIGYAVGAAVAGMIANALGLVTGAPTQTVRGVAFWVFAGFLPLAALGVLAAWRLTGRASALEA